MYGVSRCGRVQRGGRADGPPLPLQHALRQRGGRVRVPLPARVLAPRQVQLRRGNLPKYFANYSFTTCPLFHCLVLIPLCSFSVKFHLASVFSYRFRFIPASQVPSYQVTLQRRVIACPQLIISQFTCVSIVYRFPRL